MRVLTTNSKNLKGQLNSKDIVLVKSDKFGSTNGLPAGGDNGEYLRKASVTDYDAEWATLSGGGDMDKATYDPTNVSGDAFDMDNMFEGSNTKILTSTERSLIASALQSETSHADVLVDGDVGVTVQPVLVSGTNIKTINSQSVLGSGNLAVDGGAPSSSYDYSTYRPHPGTVSFTRDGNDKVTNISISNTIGSKTVTFTRVDNVVTEIDVDNYGEKRNIAFSRTSGKVTQITITNTT